jgi:hypothetical protein
MPCQQTSQLTGRSTKQSTRNDFLNIIIATLAVLGAVAASPTAQTPREREVTSGVKTVATGLDNPRGLDFAPNGALYVTEAGRGGDEPCFPGLGGEEVCWGTTGAITKVSEVPRCAYCLDSRR